MVCWTTLIWSTCLTLSGEPTAPYLAEAEARRPATSSTHRVALLPRWFSGDWFKRRSPEEVEPRSARIPFDWRRRPAPPSDWLLISRCRSVLYSDRALANSSMYVSADRGVVSLNGAVKSEVLRQRAETLARQVDGVQGVVNHLAVAAPPANSLPSASAVLVAPQTAGSEWRPAAASVPLTAESPVRQEAAPAGEAPPRKFAPPATEPLKPPAEPEGSTSLNWPLAQPDAPADRAVALGRPEVIQSKAGLPEVVTYIVRRPALPMALGRAENRIVLSPNPQQIVNGINRSAAETPVLSTAQFAIPRPRDYHAVVPTLLVEPSSEKLEPQPSGEQSPAPLGDPAGLRRDIESVLQNSDRRLTYTLKNGELLLAGRVASSKELDELFARLCNLPGVETLGFDDLRVDR